MTITNNVCLGPATSTSSIGILDMNHNEDSQSDHWVWQLTGYVVTGNTFISRTDSYGGIVTIDNLNSSDWASIFTALDYNYYAKPNISLNPAYAFFLSVGGSPVSGSPFTLSGWQSFISGQGRKDIGCEF